MDSDLHIFKGMEGFENLSSSDDSSLVAILDDLQDETLMTLFNDNLFGKELCDPLGQACIYKNEISLFPSDFPCCEVCMSDSPCCEVHMERDTSSSAEDILRKKIPINKRERVDDVYESMQKRVKLDISSEQPRSLVLDQHAALACVMHDHCYTLASEDSHSLCLSSSNSDEETANEEGSSSDTGILLLQCVYIYTHTFLCIKGYDTMSSSTSPGSSKSSSEVSSQPIPSSSVLPSSTHSARARVDPVALIEERIKVCIYT